MEFQCEGENVVAYQIAVKTRVKVNTAFTAEIVSRAAQNMVVLRRGRWKPLVASIAELLFTFADNGRIAPVLMILSSGGELEAATVARNPGNHDERLKKE